MNPGSRYQPRRGVPAGGAWIATTQDVSIEL